MSAATIPIMRPRLPSAEALRPYLETIDREGWYSNFGPLERRLEARLAERYGLPPENLACVTNCTVGLMLALRAAADDRSGYCVLPSFTFTASAHAVLAAGMQPLFVDVDPESWCITPQHAAEAIAAADGPVAAVMAVSPFGAPVDTAIWDAFTEASGIPAVIDAAAGFDTAVAGKSAVAVSLHATKVLGAGEGGFVMSRDATLARSIAVRANFGFGAVREADMIGFNGKLSEYGAAVALASLDDWPQRRQGLAALVGTYAAALGAIGNLRIAPGFGDGWVGGTCNVAFDRPVAADAMVRLADAGVDTRQWWGTGCHRQNAFAGFPRGDLSVTEDLGRRVIGLPFYEGLSEAEIAHIAAAAGAAAQR